MLCGKIRCVVYRMSDLVFPFPKRALSTKSQQKKGIDQSCPGGDQYRLIAGPHALEIPSYDFFFITYTAPGLGIIEGTVLISYRLCAIQLHRVAQNLLFCGPLPVL